MIEIREYQKEDYGTIVNQYEKLPHFFTKRAISLIRGDLKKVESYTESSYCLVATMENQIVGNLIFKRDPTGDAVYEFQWLATDTTIKKRPMVFKKLMLAGEEYLKELARIFMLYTSNTENERNTQSMFLKLGYEKQGILKDFWDDGDDKVIFIKRNTNYKKIEKLQKETIQHIAEEIKQAAKKKEREWIKDRIIEAEVLYYANNMNPLEIPLGNQLEGYDILLQSIGTDTQKSPIKLYQQGSSPFTIIQCYTTNTSDLYWIQKQTFNETDEDFFSSQLVFTQYLDDIYENKAGNM